MMRGGQDSQIQLVTIKMEILLHARNVGIIDILLIKVLDNLGQATESQEESIKTSHKGFLLGRPLKGGCRL
jgi:hypothetical protein